jgi:hypothetical protein
MNLAEYYQMYTALKLHFTTDQYNYMKYNGKIKALDIRWAKLNAKDVFKPFSKKYNRDTFFRFCTTGFLYTNGQFNIYNPKILTFDQIERLMYDMVKWNSNPREYFKQDFEKIIEIDQNFLDDNMSETFSEILETIIERVLNSHEINYNTLTFIYVYLSQTIKDLYIDSATKQILDKYIILCGITDEMIVTIKKIMKEVISK